MTPRELLGVFVRLAGLGSILFSLFDLYYVVVKTLGIQTNSQVPVWQDERGLLLYFVLGFAILACARWIVRLAYWSGAEDSK
jgi:hypothetical protein